MSIWGTASQSDSPPAPDDIWGDVEGTDWNWDKTKRYLSASSAPKRKVIEKIELDFSWKCTVVGQVAMDTSWNTGNSY